MRYLSFLIAAFAVASCTDPVDIASGFEQAQPVVDAWLTNESQPQTVNLYLTQDYFANELPPPLEGATVALSRTDGSGEPLVFAEAQPGEYVWTPSDLQPRIGAVGERFVLQVVADFNGGQVEYAATSEFRRVATIDSISVQLEEQQLGLDEGLYAQVYARDLPGTGDRYLIRSTINDTLLNRPSELNVAFDAAFDGGTSTDGIPFILPIRFGINKTDDEGFTQPLVPGDVIEVDIWSLNPAAYEFITNAQEQILNGDAQLFSVPVVSTLGNVTNAATGDPALGMFNLSAVSSARKEVE